MAHHRPTDDGPIYLKPIEVVRVVVVVLLQTDQHNGILFSNKKLCLLTSKKCERRSLTQEIIVIFVVFKVRIAIF